MIVDVAWQENSLQRKILDAIPSFIFAVDEDVRVLEYNRAAGQLLGSSRSEVLRRRGGEVLHCIHSTENPEGCGHAPFCQDCVVRSAVREAFAGTSSARRRAKLELVVPGGVREFHAFITASPFTHEGTRLVLLVIEDINELVELQRIIPICCRCKKVRTDDAFWVEVETYFKRYWDTDFSHGYCPECLTREMAQFRVPPRSA